MSKLIIIRGNSGSGKTTVAKRLQRELGYGTMLVSEDVVRREIVRVKDGPDNPAIELIKHAVLYAKRIDYDVILEGILANKHYRPMIDELLQEFAGHLRAYYFDISFEETLRRHTTKPNADAYGEVELREWWNEKDHLSIPDECMLMADKSEDEIVAQILRDFKRKST